MHSADAKQCTVMLPSAPMIEILQFSHSEQKVCRQVQPDVQLVGLMHHHAPHTTHTSIVLAQW